MKNRIFTMFAAIALLGALAAPFSHAQQMDQQKGGVTEGAVVSAGRPRVVHEYPVGTPWGNSPVHVAVRRWGPSPDSSNPIKDLWHKFSPLQVSAEKQARE